MSGMTRQKRDAEMPQQPIVVVASLLCLGVVVGWVVWLDWLFLSLFGVLLLALYLYCTRWWMTLLLLLYTGISITMVHRLASGDISGGGEYFVEIEDEAMDGVRGVLRVMSRMGSDGLWRGCSGEVRYSVEGDVGLRRGDRAIVRCSVNEFRGRYYTRLRARSVIEVRSRNSVALQQRWHERLNYWAVGRLDQLGLNKGAEVVVQAMLLGHRKALGEELVDSYRRSGAAHILAVSGLHVMIIYLLISRLLYVLHIIPFGFRLRPLLSAVVVWGYAMVVGMTPSVERAAIMFVALQLLTSLSRRYFSLSGLSIAVLLMVLFDPRIVFDVGFMLSVVAVASILMWGIPLDRRFRRWNRDVFGEWSVVGMCVSMLFSTLLLGVVCSLSTMPLVSWAFGYVSLFGILLNPIVVVTAYLLLTLSLAWIVVGVEPLAPIFRIVIDCVAAFQNGVVEYMSSGWRGATDVRISEWSVVAIYLLYVIMSLVVINGAQETRNQDESDNK